MAPPRDLSSVPPLAEEVRRRPPFGSNPVVGERGSDTQRRIFAAAIEVFGELGFSGARVELITARAGCSRPAFYQYFSSKDDVFWALAGQLGQEIVHLATALPRITPDAAGLARLTEWIGEFMDLHEAWAPVFASFQAASRGHAPQAQRSSAVSDQTGLALLRAFGAPADPRQGTLVTGLVAVLIRCSFFAEQTPSGMSRQPLVAGVATLLHRIFAGPIAGVNLLPAPPRRPGRTTSAPATSPATPPVERPLARRGARTRQRLLEAGTQVLPARGYHDARVDDVVAAAGVSHGTFYRYFTNKDDFFQVLAEATSGHMIDHLDRLHLDPQGNIEDLRGWLVEWFAIYERDGGIISTWQEMQTNERLAVFSREVATSVYTRLVRLLSQRPFGDPAVDAVMLLALIERVPYSVYTLHFTTPAPAIEAMITAIRRGLLVQPE
ncbi:MAG: TetR/AcrR family transcriptional regulator [Acidimicrobiia bacterium]|nr:TetR/AcrR family transcriptional regulator [Acidimicrobiia bacterium]